MLGEHRAHPDSAADRWLPKRYVHVPTACGGAPARTKVIADGIKLETPRRGLIRGRLVGPRRSDECLSQD